jgi:hypothetical protein
MGFRASLKGLSLDRSVLHYGVALLYPHSVIARWKHGVLDSVAHELERDRQLDRQMVTSLDY